MSRVSQFFPHPLRRMQHRTNDVPPHTTSPPHSLTPYPPSLIAIGPPAAIISRAKEGTRQMNSIMLLLSKRLQERSWIVVLKTLVVIRRLMIEHGRALARIIANDARLIRLTEWDDPSTHRGEITPRSNILPTFGSW